ncbi:DsbA family protein [Actinomyces minihominis]|uniref:DsbA family protein n=1 Tax=Actinomyces minihominis TaxID=2002838 RepID=UPI000C06EB8A|nr:DsbA family protein [Actinomyces minihominis]
MAKKNASQADVAMRDKAKQMREAQEKSDRRTRNIIIALAVVLVAAITVAIVFVVINRPTAEKAAENLPEQFKDGAPIAISSEGVGVTNPDAEDLTFYFDYSCGACTQIEIGLRPNLFDAAEAGDYNLLLQPVITAGAPYNQAATAGALVVAAEAPDLFLAFQDGLTDYFYEASINGSDTAYRDLAASEAKVAEIAKSVGVSDELIATFNTDAALSYLTTSTNTWVGADIEGRDRVATPEFVANNKSINLTAQTPEAVIDELKAALAAK